MKKIMLFSLIFVSGLFAAEDYRALKSNSGFLDNYAAEADVFIGNDSGYSNTGITVAALRHKLDDKSTHHHYHGHSGWSLVAAGSGGVVLGIAATAGIAYFACHYGYERIFRPDVSKFLTMVEKFGSVLAPVFNKK